MANERVHRRLAAILAADVVGYSRLMGEDEESTLRTLKSHCEIIDRLIVRHEGRIFGSGGDSVLAEFGSAVEAVRAAISIQEELRVHNTELVEERRMNFRIGINVGDIMVEGDNLFGDGVNVAARREGVAEPGGICISGSAFDQVKNKLSIGFEDIGLQEVKNIAEPVPAFRVVPGQVSAAAGATPTVAKRWRTPTIAAVVVVILAVGGVAWWQPWVPDEEPASIDEMAFPLPKKPSIAVLPFDNLSGDPKQEYISDGMSENIIAALSRIPAMFVIARNSTFTYKGKPVKVQKVAQELGVRYVLEGSVQRAGDRIRITTQLIDALSGHHLWANQYDRDFKDIFALQDDISRNVATALQVRLTAGEQARAWRRETESAEAYELFLRGNAVRRTGSQSKSVNAEAQRLYEKSVELDPGFTSAWLWLASTHQLDARYGWSNSRRRSLASAGDAVRKALAIDDTRPGAYHQLANIAVIKRQYDQAIGHCEKALTLNPTSQVMAHCGRIWTYVGRPQEALELINKAMRRNPYFPPIYLFILGNAHRLLGNYDEAIAARKAQRDANPNSLSPLVGLAYTYAEAGRMDEARATVEEILKRSPKFSLKRPKRLLNL